MITGGHIGGCLLHPDLGKMISNEAPHDGVLAGGGQSPGALISSE